MRPAAIAALAQCVHTAFREGDSVAIGILRGSADELESSALSVARRLDLVGESFPFVLAGGMFKAVPWLHDELDRRLPLASPASRTLRLDVEPAIGAVRLALADARGVSHHPGVQSIDCDPGRAPVTTFRIRAFAGERALAKTLAAAVADALRRNPRLVIGLPTGRTPIKLYRELVALHGRGQAEFAEATTFNLDEFAGLPASHPGSYRTFMDKHLFSHVNIDPAPE